MVELWLIKSDYKYNITPITSGLEWTTDIKSVGADMKFSFVQNDDKYIQNLDVREGDNVSLLDIESDGTVTNLFRGIIIDCEPSKKNGDVKCSAFDYSYYLTKNEETIQFNNVRADKAIQQICDMYTINVEVPVFYTMIKHIYFDMKLSDIIKDILEKIYEDTGYRYRMEFVNNRLVITHHPSIEISGINMIHDERFMRTIADMYNSIKVVSGSEERFKVEAETSDKANIGKYGVMQMVHSVSDKDISQAKNIANNLLKENNKVKEFGTISTDGDTRVRAGRVLNISEINSNFNGKFIIKSCTHEIKNKNHKMTMELEIL